MKRVDGSIVATIIVKRASFYARRSAAVAGWMNVQPFHTSAPLVKLVHSRDYLNEWWTRKYFSQGGDYIALKYLFVDRDSFCNFFTCNPFVLLCKGTGHLKRDSKGKWACTMKSIHDNNRRMYHVLLCNRFTSYDSSISVYVCSLSVCRYSFILPTPPHWSWREG